MKKESYRPDKNLAAVCGLFCPSCIIFIAQRESPKNRKLIAESIHIPVEDLHCDGCRSENRFAYCDTCKMASCAEERGIEFCGECEEYPCKELEEFQAAMSHRIELWQNQSRIREVGYEQWFEEMLEHYACSQCGTINSAYHLVCRACGFTPSCAYVNLHRDKIKDSLPNES